MSWTINENSKTSTTEYFNATHTDISAPAAPPTDAHADTAFKNVAGYVSGTINFVVSPAPDSGGGTAWAAGSTLEISIIGRIGSGFTPSQAITFGVLPILEITKGDLNSTFSIEWDIPLEEVSLHINNATLFSTGREITIENISMQTESQGGGVGHMTTSLGPLAFAGDPNTSLQYNDSGTFGGASGALYDKNAGQIKLANGSAGVPILAFSDGTHPGGNYDTGIFRANVDAVGFSARGNKIVGVYGTGLPPFIKGLNVGLTINICGIQRLSATVGNSWEDGWMGNPTQLVFTGSDFTNYNTAVDVPQEFAVASAQSTGGTGFVMGQAAGADGNQIIAVKLLPKGFRVQSGATVSVATADQTPAPPPGGETVWNNTATIHLVTQDINIPTNPSSSFGTATMATWSAAGMNTDLTTVAASSVGNGTISVVIIITILNTIQIDFTSSLIGVIVPIERQ